MSKWGYRFWVLASWLFALASALGCRRDEDALAVLFGVTSLALFVAVLLLAHAERDKP